MLVGMIKNPDNSFEYLNLINGRLFCTHLGKDGFKPSNLDYIQSLVKKLFLNDNCSYLEKYNGYRVYFDNETKFKHFVKDGKENLELFYVFNGQDAILYDNSWKDKALNTAKIFLLAAGCAIILRYGIFLVGELRTPLAPAGYDINIAMKNIYSAEEISQMYDNGKITYQDAIDYIYSSNLDDEMKTFLANEDLLRDVFSYYKGTPLEYSAFLKFNGINIKYKCIEKMGTLGEYNELEPSTLYISDIFTPNPSDNKYNEYLFSIMGDKDVIDGAFLGVVGHELGHLIQAEGSPWKYLLESAAELLAHEYFGTDIRAYYSGVKNLKLLTEIIGPDSIMKLLFSGDDSEFINILKNNLSQDEYAKLATYLQRADILDEHPKENKEIQGLLCTLYKNIYGKDISEDPNILFDLRYAKYSFDGKSRDPFYYEQIYYLNVNNMDGQTEYTIYDIDIDYLVEIGLVKKENMGLYEKEISLDEYKKLSSEDNSQYSIGFTPVDENSGYIRDVWGENGKVVYVDQDGNTYPLDEAANLGYVSIYARQSLPLDNNEELIKKSEQAGWEQISIYEKYVSTYPTIDITSPDMPLTIMPDNMATRFPQDYNKMTERSKSNHSHQGPSLT